MQDARGNVARGTRATEHAASLRRARTSSSLLRLLGKGDLFC